jgi:hypothetical protein
MKIPKTILAVLAIGALSCGLFSQQAQAAQITGDINFVGSVSLDNIDLSQAHAVNHWFDVFNNDGHSTVAPGNSGSFTVIPAGTQATMGQPWTFNPSTPLAGLWSVTFGGVTFSFDLISATIITQTTTFLNILGEGTLHGTGFDDTPGTFSFTISNSDGKRHLFFGFQASGAAQTPDGGSAVALLGIALTGIEVLRRKLRIG